MTEYLNCPNSLHKGQWLGIGDHNETRLQTLGTKYSVPGRRFVFIILYSYENSLLCCCLFLIYSGCGCGDLEKYHLFITLQQTSQPRSRFVATSEARNLQIPLSDFSFFCSSYVDIKWHFLRIFTRV